MAFHFNIQVTQNEAERIDRNGDKSTARQSLTANAAQVKDSKVVGCNLTENFNYEDYLLVKNNK